MRTGTIAKAYGRFYTVWYDSGMLNCVLRGKLKQEKTEKNPRKFSEPVAVGDVVQVEAGDEPTGAIRTVMERRNVFTRKDRDRDREDLIAANLDQIVIIQSFRNPDVNPRFVDRVLVRGEKEGIPAILVVNKADLAVEDEFRYIDDYYRHTGTEVITVSAREGSGLEQLREALAGKVSIFIGYSGVGKSTLVNALYPGLELRTADVSESTGKGRHTTTNVEMIRGEGDARLIDTPGVREFGLMDIEPPDLQYFFADFVPFIEQCRFKPCTHDHEPGCAVKEAVDEGEINEGRYVSYLHILQSLKEYYDNRYK